MALHDWAEEGWSLYQAILERAKAATDVHQVAMTRLDRSSGKVRIVAVSGLGGRLFSRALGAVRRFVPNYDILKVQFSMDVNPLNAAVYGEGSSMSVSLAEVSKGIVPGVVLQITQRFYGTRYCFIRPLKVEGEIFGALGFNSVEPLAESARLTSDAFAAQVELTLENVRMIQRLEREVSGAREARRRLMASDRLLREVEIVHRGMVVEFDDIVLDANARTVVRAGSPLLLSPLEFQLLSYLMRHAGIAVSREQLVLDVWGYDKAVGSNFVDVAVLQLRRKLEQGGGSRVIHAVRGYGFILRSSDQPD